MTGGGDDGTTPMPPADTTPPPPAPSFSDIDGLNSAQRLLAINAVANTEKDSITQSTNADDSISATDSAGNLMFHVVNGERRAVMVDNSNANWAANPPPLSTFSYIFDKDTGDRKTDLAEYENGDFYAVTGFWYRDSDDFGVFVDGSPRTVDLPPSGSASYKGDVSGQYWGDPAGAGNTDAPSISGNFIGNINLRAAIPASASGSNNTLLEGEINIPAGDDLPSINLAWTNMRDNNANGIFVGNDFLLCLGGCNVSEPDASVFNARFVGNPVNIAGSANSEGWPAGIIGAFGLDELELSNGVEIDAIGFFGAIHEDLCAATETDDSAAFCTK